VGRALGVPISLDLSWFIILALILGTFSAASFPALLPGQERLTYLVMGSAGAFLFFASLLIHELSHAVEARRRGIEVEGITLFVFGGMARTRSEPERPLDEFVIAGVGPLASAILAGLFVGLSVPAARLGWDPTAVVLRYLGILNLALALFNLLPGFPLDGGRLLRAAVWGATGSLRTGTRVATRAGRLLGLLLMGVGFLGILGGGGFIGGLWMVFIGWFLMQAAGSSYDQLLLTEVLRGITAREGMTGDPETVPPDLSVDALVHDHFLKRPYSAFPVTDDGIVVGLVSLSSVKGLERDRWSDLRVADIMSPLEETVVVEPELPMLQVLERMSRSGNRRALVARDWELLGIISARDLARWLDRAALVTAQEKEGG
jgi:Zn-dependent protease/predicted transcriptional regulator